ncbi:MAG: hypothetical protein HC879_18665 [Leptolyngbyaceae cyanobacterium SL_5_9]|nr:hypothetical protein [Leptolyngbyaceae cyanobacterium SL_5_9]
MQFHRYQTKRQLPKLAVVKRSLQLDGSQVLVFTKDLLIQQDSLAKWVRYFSLVSPIPDTPQAKRIFEKCQRLPEPPP